MPRGPYLDDNVLRAAQWALRRGETIKSMRGVQQGDPCASAAFCWAIQEICEALDELVEWQVWYMDDGDVIL